MWVRPPPPLGGPCGLQLCGHRPPEQLPAGRPGRSARDSQCPPPGLPDELMLSAPRGAEGEGAAARIRKSRAWGAGRLGGGPAAALLAWKPVPPRLLGSGSGSRAGTSGRWVAKGRQAGLTPLRDGGLITARRPSPDLVEQHALQGPPPPRCTPRPRPIPPPGLNGFSEESEPRRLKGGPGRPWDAGPHVGPHVCPHPPPLTAPSPSRGPAGQRPGPSSWDPAAPAPVRKAESA